MRPFAGEHPGAATCELVGAQPVATCGPGPDAPRFLTVQTVTATQAAHEGLRLDVPRLGSFLLIHRTGDYPSRWKIEPRGLCARGANRTARHAVVLPSGRRLIAVDSGELDAEKGRLRGPQSHRGGQSPGTAPVRSWRGRVGRTQTHFGCFPEPVRPNPSFSMARRGIGARPGASISGIVQKRRAEHDELLSSLQDRRPPECGLARAGSRERCCGRRIARRRRAVVPSSCRSW